MMRESRSDETSGAYEKKVAVPLRCGAAQCRVGRKGGEMARGLINIQSKELDS